MTEPTQHIFIDNTMITAYRECPRKFLFRHKRGWIHEGAIPIDLVFGLAWHEALAVLWGGGTVASATLAFTKTWVEQGLPEPKPANYQIITEINDKKTPWIAMEMLENYAKQRGKFISECDSIEIERPFAVPLGLEWNGRKVFYIGRLDKSVNHRVQGRLIVEHKTTGSYAKEGGFRSDYLESFSPNSQVDGYIFASNSLYPEGVKAVWVDAALCHKTVHDKFKFIPCDRQFAMLDDWLSDARDWVTRMLTDIDKYDADTAAFPKNTSMCWMYGRPCSYKSLCKFVANIQKSAAPMPDGYKEEFWQPFDVLKVNKILAELQ